MVWDHFRSSVPAVDQVVYMNTGWSGPLCKAAHEAIRERMEQEYQYGPVTPPIHEAGREVIQQARATIGRLINATPDCIALTQSASHAINLIFSGLAFTMGETVVTTDAEHHALLVPAYYAKRRLGIGLRIVDVAEDADEQLLIARFDEAITHRTRLVALSHVFFNVGLRLPARQIIDIAHSRGALVLLDGAQAVGQFPVDVQALNVDFYTVSGHKWLLGPAGVGGLYIRRELVDQVEAVMVARNATRSYDTRGTMEPRRDSVEKFDLTEMNTPLWAGLIAAINFMQSTGLASIETRIKELARHLGMGLASIDGVRMMCPPPGPLATGLIPFAVEGISPDDLIRALWEGAGVVARTVPGRPACRLCVHAFNTAEEIEGVVGFISEVVDRIRRPVLWSWR